MAEPLMFGAKVRALRRREKMTQQQLAERLGISASYLNLIENNRRPLSANLLLKLAEQFALDLSAFAPGDESQLAMDLREVFADPMFESTGLTQAEVRELARGSPAAARAILKLYQNYCSARQSAESMAESLFKQGAFQVNAAVDPTEEVNDLLQRHGNFFPEIEAEAESLWDEARLHFDDVWSGLVTYLRERHGIEVRVVQAEDGQAMRKFDSKRGLITLSEVLPPRTRRFQLAHQVGLLRSSDVFDALEFDKELRSSEACALAHIVLANYFAAAVLMPYQPFLESAERGRYDIELLAHRYRTSFEQVCHRLTTLRRPGAEGIPLHFIRIDIAGNISKRFSASGIRMPRFSGACPRWNVHAAFLTPGLFRIQLSRMPDGQVYFCIARTVRRDTGCYTLPPTVHSIGIGCELRHARKMIYSDGIDLDSPNATTPVGVSCRTCEQMDCEQRVSPPMQYPVIIDENVRGISFFAPVVHDQTRNKP